MAQLENGLMQIRFTKSCGCYNRNDVACFTMEQLVGIDESVYSTDVEGSEDKELALAQKMARKEHKDRVLAELKKREDAQKGGKKPDTGKKVSP